MAEIRAISRERALPVRQRGILSRVLVLSSQTVVGTKLLTCFSRKIHHVWDGGLRVRHARVADTDADFQQFAVNAGRAPTLGAEAADQTANLSWDRSPFEFSSPDLPRKKRRTARGCNTTTVFRLTVTSDDPVRPRARTQTHKAVADVVLRLFPGRPLQRPANPSSFKKRGKLPSSQ